MREIFGETRFLVVTGNYGSGKTEISLNLALKASDEGKTTLVDLDIVNPYFRSGEKADERHNGYYDCKTCHSKQNIGMLFLCLI